MIAVKNGRRKTYINLKRVCSVNVILSLKLLTVRQNPLLFFQKSLSYSPNQIIDYFAHYFCATFQYFLNWSTAGQNTFHIYSNLKF